MEDDSDLTLKKQFFDSVKATVASYKNQSVPIEFSAPRWTGVDAPQVESFYVKPVYICAPHLNFPTVKIPCDKQSCCGFYVGKGWADARLLYGLSTSAYLLQYRYHCDNEHCVKYRTYECTETVINSRRCPEFLRQHYVNLFYLTKRAGVTGELKSYILPRDINNNNVYNHTNTHI